jgi:hypothetical protein
MVFTLGGAGLHPGKGLSALEYRACAQNVSDVSHSFTFRDAGVHPGKGLYKCSGVPRLRTECVRC